MLAYLLPAESLLLVGLHPEQLFLIVPFVERARLVETLVTLQPNEISVENFGQHLRDLGLARPRGTLDKQRLLQRERKKDRRLDALVGDVASALQPVRNLFMRKVHRSRDGRATRN